MTKKYWNLLKEKPEPGLELTQTEWQFIKPYLTDHRLEGYIYKFFGPALPADLKENLSVQWQSQWLKNHLYLKELEELRKICKAGGLHFTVLKGAAMLPALYPDLGSRQMSDLDLLVSSPETIAFQNMLLENYYHQVKSTAWKANNFKFTYTKKIQAFDLVVELHNKLFLTESLDNLWESTGQDLKVLTPTDHLIHLIGHFSYQHTFLKLFWLMDIDRWIRRFEKDINWARLVNISEKLRMKKAVNATLWITHQFLGTPVPKGLLRPLSPVQKIFLTENFLWKTKFNLSYYLLKFDLKDSLKDTIEYSALWLIQKTKQIFNRPQIP